MARVPAWISSPSSNHTRNISDMHVPKIIKKRFSDLFDKQSIGART